MPLRPASSIMSYSSPACPDTHTRPVRKTGAGKDATTEPDPDWVLTCTVCEPTLVGHELWGPADHPAPLTADEVRLVEAQQKAANMNILEGLAALPQFAQTLQSLLGTVSAAQSAPPQSPTAPRTPRAKA